MARQDSKTLGLAQPDPNGEEPAAAWTVCVRAGPREATAPCSFPRERRKNAHNKIGASRKPRDEMISFRGMHCLFTRGPRRIDRPLFVPWERRTNAGFRFNNK